MKMKNLTLTICLTLALLLGSTGTSWGADFMKGLAAYQSGDYATALREFRPLAEQGDADAQFNLGLMYYNGLGVPQDYKTAVKWYTLAAEQGIVDAQYNLGWMYYKGQGVSQDYVYAHMWRNVVAFNGYETGDLRDEVAKEMTADQIEKAEQLAQECVRKEYKGC
jgi:hypothetical protein